MQDYDFFEYVPIIKYGSKEKKNYREITSEALQLSVTNILRDLDLAFSKDFTYNFHIPLSMSEYVIKNKKTIDVFTAIMSAEPDEENGLVHQNSVKSLVLTKWGNLFQVINSPNDFYKLIRAIKEVNDYFFGSYVQGRYEVVHYADVFNGGLKKQ